MKGCDPSIRTIDFTLLFSIQLNADVERSMDPELAELLV